MKTNSYTSLQVDVLRELANIGGGNAATSISTLIGKVVDMDIPRVEILNYDDVYQKIMEEDALVNAILIKMQGAAQGCFLFVTTLESGSSLAGMMLPEGIELEQDIKVSALQELINILVSSYLNAITKMVDRDLTVSVPVYIEDMFGAILSSAYMEFEQYDENILIMKNEFYYENNKIEGSLYFIPEPGVLDKLFNIIGV